MSEKKKPDPSAVMDALRLARSGNYTTVRKLRSAFAEMYPELTKEETAAVFEQLARIVA
jgi:hypothetical protein